MSSSMAASGALRPIDTIAASKYPTAERKQLSASAIARTNRSNPGSR
jgi:hypothetical protein